MAVRDGVENTLGFTIHRSCARKSNELSCTRKVTSDKYRRNHGRPGFVYILRNSALQAGLYKIGQTTRSGSARARDLNAEATTGLPAEYQCVYEARSRDCGLAEERVHAALAAYRRGKWGQEFFEVELEQAKQTIESVVRQINQEMAESESDQLHSNRRNSSVDSDDPKDPTAKWPFPRKSPAVALPDSSARSLPELNARPHSAQASGVEGTHRREPSWFRRYWPILLILFVVKALYHLSQQ